MDDRRMQQDDDQPPAQEASLGGRIRLWGGIAAAAVLAIFLLQNLNETAVTFLFWEQEIPLIFALVISAALGAIASMLFSYLRRRSKEAELRERAALQREKDRKR